MHPARSTIECLLGAIESRDLRAVRSALSPGATWQNVPHPAVEGRDAVVAMLAGILTWSDVVRWDVVSAAYEGHRGWVERVDRFVIDGHEHAVSCNGLFTVDPVSSTVMSVRDYVDLADWRDRIAPVYASMSARPAGEVVRRHLLAVERGDVIAMASDYALDATLERAGEKHSGWDAIADYFDTVPNRLTAGSLTFGDVIANDATHASVAWTVADDSVVLASGHDHFGVADGRITSQVVRLDAADF